MSMQFGWWVIIEQLDDPVVITLIEYLCRLEDTLPGSDALGLFDSHFHTGLLSPLLRAAAADLSEGARFFNGLPATVPPSTGRTVPVT